ncbi:MAG: hypothetical protein ACREF7_03390 [Candidatus Saccharimonadales bacterium]
MIKDRTIKVTLSLSIITAFLYNIWPLGYFLDPNALHDNYFSVLESYSRPYAWVFILGDGLTAMIVILIGIWLYKLLPTLRSALTGYITFGVATLIEASTPISSRCGESINACGISPAQIISFHDLASIIAAFGLFFALLKGMRHFRSLSLDSNLHKLLSATFWFWSLSGLFLILSVAINKATIISQALFLMACGLALFILPFAALHTAGYSSTEAS